MLLKALINASAAYAMDVSDFQEAAHPKNKSNIPCLSFHTAQECFGLSLSKSPKVHIIVILWQNGEEPRKSGGVVHKYSGFGF